jgi:hypothetical protein
MSRISIAVAAAVSGALLAPAAAPAQQPPASSPAAVDPKAVLGMEAGVWDADITFPATEPGQAPRKAKGVQTNRLRSGGMWIVNELSVEGTPYEGTGVWGYDRVTGRYSGIWVDNNDQQFRTDDGRWDPATQTMTWTADMPQPDGRHMRLLFTEKFEGKVRRFDMVALTRKGEVPLVSMVFTRRS